MSLCRNAVRLDDLDADGCRLVFVQEAAEFTLSHEFARCLCPCMLSVSALYTLRADDCFWQHVMVLVVLGHKSCVTMLVQIRSVSARQRRTQLLGVWLVSRFAGHSKTQELGSSSRIT